MIEKILEISGKLVVYFFQYFKEKPTLALTLKGTGCERGPSHKNNYIFFRWRRELILHNDDANLVRGIKLLYTFPEPWIVKNEIPTKLEPDEKYTIYIEAYIEEDHGALLNKFGINMHQRLSNAIFPNIVSTFELEFELKNQKGRTLYQYSTFAEDGRVTSTISTKRRNSKLAS